MNRMIAFAGAVASLVLVAVGCGSDQVATELAEANTKSSATARERDAVKERLAKAESANVTAASKVADLSKRLGEAQAQLTAARAENKQREQEAATDQNARRVAGKQITDEHDASEEKSRALVAENREPKDKLAKIAVEKPVAQIPADAPIPKNVRLANQYPIRMAPRTNPPVPLIYLDDSELEMGAIGKLRIQDTYPYLKVEEILDKEKMIVVPILDDRHVGNLLVISGVPTGRYATGTEITELPQSFEIAHTERFGSSTLFVASVIDDDSLRAKLKSYYDRLRPEGAKAGKTPAKSNKKGS
jgi:hypothetical protein